MGGISAFTSFIHTQTGGLCAGKIQAMVKKGERNTVRRELRHKGHVEEEKRRMSISGDWAFCLSERMPRT